MPAKSEQAALPNARPRPLHVIASDIRRDWRNPHFAASPYIRAMALLTTIDDMYGADSAEYVVTYFLSNAASWHGRTARRVKAELNRMLKDKK